jgi:hypothetical protein
MSLVRYGKLEIQTSALKGKKLEDVLKKFSNHNAKWVKKCFELANPPKEDKEEVETK